VGGTFREVHGDNAGVRIEAFEWSPPGEAREGLPIVFVPGGTGNARFGEVHGRAAAAGRIGSRPRGLLSVSRRGMGRSDAPQSGYAMADFAGDVRAAVAAAGYERFVLFGHSMGAVIALDYVLRFPRAVAALALGDVPPRYIDFKAANTFGPFLAEPFTFASWEAARASMRPTGDADEDARRWERTKQLILTEDADRTVRLLVDRDALLRTVDESVTANTDYGARLREIPCPVLLIISTVGWSPVTGEDVAVYEQGVRDLTIARLATDHGLGQHADAGPLHAALGALADRADATD
jgi:pimeloyl-ACP methyl ester carboxylesterase